MPARVFSVPKANQISQNTERDRYLQILKEKAQEFIPNFKYKCI